MTPSIEPSYNKPDKPGIWMGFNNVVSLYHVVEEQDDFRSAALHVFGMIKEAQERYPDWERVFYLDINGHKGDRAGFDDDFFEFQQEFLVVALGPFLTALDLPIVSVWNPEPQRNDLPDAIAVE